MLAESTVGSSNGLEMNGPLRFLRKLQGMYTEEETARADFSCLSSSIRIGL